ncbi:carbohydrate porin [Spirulina sp. CS-785/01]|uniref:carbohydrate porin n=1 Tax=Spirulina sp. CS-785/01 TaxID=3021716 RepID=UPI002A4E0BDF|nr:carbohydrate porin [Spirulina sp. CS-785/01]
MISSAIINFPLPPNSTVKSSNGVLAGNLPSIFEGNLVTNTNGGRRDSTYHLEAFYRSRLSPNITLTPGVVLLLNPGHNAGSEPILMVGLRTTLSF